MKKFLLGLIIIVAILGLIGVGGLGYLGFLAPVSKLLGTDKPRDLGVSYTQEDIDYIDTRGQDKKVLASEAATPEQSIRYVGQHQVDYTMTSAQFTALANKYSDWVYYPGQDLQVKIHPDGSGEVSGLIRVNTLIRYVQATENNFSTALIQKGLDYLKIGGLATIPFYASGTIGVSNNQVSEINVTDIEIGRLGIPVGIVSANIGVLENFCNDQLADVPGLNLQTLKNNAGSVLIQGFVPDQINVATTN